MRLVHREDDPRLPRVRISTREDEDEQLRRVWRHERGAVRGEEGADAVVPRARDERSGAPEKPDFRWWGPY
jgi:hypothetical protein